MAPFLPTTMTTGVFVIYLQSSVSTLTTSAYQDQYEYAYNNRPWPSAPLRPFRRYRDDFCEPGGGYLGSCEAFYISPRVDRSEEVREEVPAVAAPAKGAVRRTFGAPRQRVPIRSRPGANALAA